MREVRLKVINPLGLHARAAAQLVRLAGRYSSRITLTRFDSNITANAKSILSLLALAAAKGTELRVVAEGGDADDAIVAVEELFFRGFGEI